MAMIRDMATFTVKSLGLHKVTATTEKDWKIVNKIIVDKLESDNA